MEKDKETKKELEEQVEELKKSNKIMKGLLIVLVVLILFGTCFGGGFLIGQKLADKEEDLLEENKKDDKTEEKEETKTDAPEKEEEKVDNTISDALRKDLDKKVDLTRQFVVTGLYYKKGGELKNIINENVDAYSYFAYATYNYYLYKTGDKQEQYTTKDPSLATCYDQAQNGYCFVASKANIEKYNKELYNVSMDAFNLGDWTTTKGDKIYVTPVPWNGAVSSQTDSVVSVVRNGDTIEYVAKQSIKDYDKVIFNVDVKYIFKANEDGNFYLHSFEKM